MFGLDKIKLSTVQLQKNQNHFVLPQIIHNIETILLHVFVHNANSQKDVKNIVLNGKNTEALLKNDSHSILFINLYFMKQ